MTLQQVAIRAGIPYSAVRSYSAADGASPTPGRLAALAKALKVKTTDLAPLQEAYTLHELRWHAGLTVAQVAEKVGYSVSHTSLVLSGVSPITEPKRWAEALQVSQRRIASAWTTSRAEHGARSESPEAQ